MCLENRAKATGKNIRDLARGDREMMPETSAEASELPITNSQLRVTNSQLLLRHKNSCGDITWFTPDTPHN
ncbi:MAG TPA: hypothetical protein DCS91_21635 [Microcoleaceae bacterium UBA11344]|jgi:hypothetical protein|nr:hypothetical protein [Microcoleaceae cyanobacterium UBA11344]